MNTFQCPVCGASLQEGIAMCSVCKTSIDWQDGQPVVTSAGRAVRHVGVVIFIALMAAALVLAATLLVISRI